VAIVAAASALLIVPSLPMLLSRRISQVKPPAQTGGWYRLANGVMRRPALVAAGTAVLLLAIASPTLHVRWSGIDATVLPASQSARVVSDSVARDFPPSDNANAILVVASAPASVQPMLASYAASLARLVGITQASAPAQLGPGTWEIKFASPADPISAAGQQAVKAVRALPAPVPVLVGGSAADFADQGASIAATLPLALTILVVVTMFVLWLLTGSLVLAIKTLLMNALTAAAATGILVFIFQDGRLTGLLSYRQADHLRIDLARRGHRSVRHLQARVPQEVGHGVAAAVLIDAFIVRALLVPSLMALLGRRNWWAPAPLKRLHQRLGLSEAESSQPPRPPARPT
jgi:uncharacterized membrane protein YdfJ with MMPL/SSD domain